MLRSVQFGVIALAIMAAAMMHSLQAAEPSHFVDNGGVLRATADKQPAAFFGVNYSAPFAFGRRAIRAEGVEIKAAIDADVAHFSRLGLNGYRVHVWDREIADANGHLVANEHLDAFDYLLAKLKENDIRVILTPVAWWPPGYPEPDPLTDSFSDRWSREEMVITPAAITVLQTYIAEFLSHSNPYTGLSYIDDPNIIAVELFNEPKHRKATSEQTVAFINALVQAARGTGLTKPLFYNISEEGANLEHGRAVCSADIQGVSYQWYPTGLTRGSRITANVAPNVAEYANPFRELAACRDKARMVYEFDAADVAAATMFPLMASSFRDAGFQWATQFAYDPLHIANINAEYFTHYLNLVYTPRKAISLAIAADVFSHERFAEEKGEVDIQVEENLAVYRSAEKFRHTGPTATKPSDTALLRSIAAVGSSPLVQYGGNGAYFLDRVNEDSWELEVYPDVLELSDPFTFEGISRPVRSLIWREQAMVLSLPGLGEEFHVFKTDGEVRRAGKARDGMFKVTPGTWTLSARSRPGSLVPRKFHALPGETGISGVQHAPAAEIPAGSELEISAEVFAESVPQAVTLHVRRQGHRGFQSLPMQVDYGYRFSATVPADHAVLSPGIVEYAVSIESGGQKKTFPADVPQSPGEWNYTGQKVWQTRVVSPGAPLVVFAPARDHQALFYPHTMHYGDYAVDFAGTGQDGSQVLKVRFDALPSNVPAIALRTQFDTRAHANLLRAGEYSGLQTVYRSSCGAPYRVSLALSGGDGTAWGVTLPATSEWQPMAVPFTALEERPLALLPRAYPTFQHAFAPPADEAESGNSGKFSIAGLDGVQLVLEHNPGNAKGSALPCSVELGEIELR